MDYDQLITLIIKYGGARLAAGLAIGDADPDRTRIAREESDETFDQLQAAVYRLFRDRGADV